MLLLSFLQICFIPGFIAMLMINRKSESVSLPFVPVFSFALSLIINYLIVTSLAYFGLYTRQALLALIAAELIFLAFSIIYGKFNINRYKPVPFARLPGVALFQKEKNGYYVFHLAAAAFSAALLLYLLIQTVFNSGKIFEAWDAVFSWNRWAIDLSGNKLPSSIYHYPQLIPSNWSVGYILCGYPLQYLPKGIMPLFLFFPVYSLFILGINRRTSSFMLAAFLLALTLNNFNWKEGYADVPIAFFSFTTLLSLIIYRDENSAENGDRYLLLGALLVCGAAVTKQAGIFLLVLYPVLAWIFTVKNKWTGQKIFSSGSVLILMILLIVVPAYVYAEAAIRRGAGASEISYVTNEIYNGASGTERIRNAAMLFSGIYRNSMFSGLVSRIIFITAAGFFILSLKNRISLLLFLSFVLPYSIIWALFFSYDIRNSALIIPFFCLGTGYGLDLMIRKIFKATECQ